MDSPAAGSPVAPASPLNTSLSASASALPETQQFKNAITKELFGKKMTVVTWNAQQYLIGVQIAHYLKRETFNLYRSMKLANIDIIKCQPSEIEELTQLDAIKRGIHSVTLVPYDQGVAYISKELRRKPRKKCEKRSRKDTDIVLSGSPSNSASPVIPSDVINSSDGFGSDSVENDESRVDESGSASDASPEPAPSMFNFGKHSSANPEVKRLHWQRLLQFALLEHSRIQAAS